MTAEDWEPVSHTLQASQLPGYVTAEMAAIYHLSHPICIPDCVVKALAPLSVNDLGVQYHLCTEQKTQQND